MRPIYHVAVSGALALVQWRLTGDRRAALWTFLSGTLIDLDHLPDYLLNARREEIRLTFVLHSWELWGAVAVIAWARGGVRTALGVVGSPVLHLWLDVWGNRVPARFFLFFWRAQRGFSVRSIRTKPVRRTFPTAVHAIPSYILANLIGPLRRPRE
ncbi:MAG: hypothetical protein RMM58_13845 [Chloroflexota bacterium]|nr:hypothetical protein [Dehalococcoidia bacterium]MDW8254954.1 hypothetical protein [Chloroflexota bacterium]